MKRPLLIALRRLVGCTGPRPQTIAVTLTPPPTLAHPQRECRAQQWDCAAASFGTLPPILSQFSGNLQASLPQTPYLSRGESSCR